MDLDDYLFYKKKKIKYFNKKSFATELGVTHSYLLRLANGAAVPSAQIGYKLHVLSNGEIDVWKMIVDFYEKKEKED